jgi:hypothetical protein
VKREGRLSVGLGWLRSWLFPVASQWLWLILLRRLRRPSSVSVFSSLTRFSFSFSLSFFVFAFVVFFV